MKKYYTFSVKGQMDGKLYYPKQYSWQKEDVKPGTGLLDFELTENKNEAKFWSDKEICLDIALEFVDSEVIELEKDFSKECPFCGSNNIEKIASGTNPGKIISYTCKDCNETYFLN